MLRTSVLFKKQQQKKKKKKKKRSNYVNTDDLVMILSFYDFPHSPLSVYKVLLNYLLYFFEIFGSEITL